MRVRRLVTAVAVVTLTIGVGVAALAASDPYRTQQWNLERVEAPMAWELSRGAGILIAVIDTGVDLEHPDLVDRIARRADGSVRGRDYVDNDDDPDDENGHGTLVAGVAAATADNGVGVAGIAPAARIMPIRVLDEDGAGDGADVDRAIRWAVDEGAHVINLSLESVGSSPGVRLPIPAPTSAVRYAWANGVIVVAASGNDASRSDDYPEDSPVVLVGATTREDQRAPFSDAGRTDALMAPGVDIISTWWCDPTTSEQCQREHGYAEAQGTSFSAPHVTGAAAILRALGFDHEQTVQRLRDTARDLGEPGPDEETGYGLIDVAAAAGARNPPSSPSPSPSPQPTAPASPTSSPTPVSSPSGTPSSPTPVSPPPSQSDEPSPSPTETRTVDEPSPSVTDAPSPDASASPSAVPTTRPSPGDPVASAERDPESGGPARAVAVGLLSVTVAAQVLVRRRSS